MKETIHMISGSWLIITSLFWLIILLIYDADDLFNDFFTPGEIGSVMVLFVTILCAGFLFIGTKPDK